MPAVIPAIILILVLVFYLGRFATAWRVAAVILGATLLDQGAKAWVIRQETASHFFKHSLWGWLQISYAENHTLGFGASPSFLLLATIICVIPLLLLYPRLAGKHYHMPILTEVGCALMAGGLLGILLDRMRLGFVVDFLEFGEQSNFTYNIADICIFGGLAFMAAGAVRFLLSRRKDVLPAKKTISTPPADGKHLLWIPASALVMAVSLGFLWRFGGDEEFFLTPLHKAVLHGENAAVTNLLVKGADPNVLDSKYGQTPLHCAVGAANVAAAEILLANGADPNAADSEFCATPLDIALLKGNVHIAQLLLKHGANTSESSLYHALRSRDPSVVKVLLDRGVDLNRTDGDRTPLTHAASYARNPETLELLLAAGAEVNARDGNGKTALHYAAASNQADRVKLLLDAGAAVNVKDDNGKTPLDVMTGPVTSLGGESLNEMAVLLIAYGAEVNTLSRDGRTPLIRAVLRRDTELINTLLEAQADVNQTGVEGRTALHYAAAKGLTEAAEMLIAAGATLNIKDDKGITPLQLAKDKKMVELLS